jgi:hypothetical protein
VESAPRGKAIRLQHLVPIPRGDELGAMRSGLLARLDAQHDGARFAAERAQSLPLPAVAFDARRTRLRRRGRVFGPM